MSLTGEQSRKGSCLEGCGACCKFIRLQVNPQYKDEDISNWIGLHGISLRSTTNALFAYVPLRCEMLSEDDRCMAYDDRPNVCRNWPTSQVEIDDLHEFVGEEVCGYFFEDSITSQTDSISQEV